MNKNLLPTGALALVLLGLIRMSLPAADNPASAPAAPDKAPTLLKRGDYLVNQVGLCIDCHSPRDEKGQFLKDRHLRGSPIAFSPTVPMPWAPAAPPIAGLPAGWSSEMMIHFLMTGERPFNLPPVRPPMPPYRLNQEDAEAVVGYLRSLLATPN